MSLLNSLMTILLRVKEKMGFKLSEKEEMAILLDDVNKIASMLLRIAKVREKMLQKRIGNESPEIEHDEYVNMSPELSKAKIKLENKNDDEEDIRRYIN